MKLNAVNITYSDFKADGSDLTFYTSSLDDRLDYEIDTWNTSGDSYIWVKIPSITGSSDTGYFWMYYSSNVNTGTQNTDSVWSDDYRAVFHLDEAGVSYSDSSPYNNTGTGGTNGQSDPVLISGLIGDAQNFPSTTDSIAIPANSSINTLNNFTYSFWVYNAGIDGDRLLSKGNFQLWVPLNTRIRATILQTDGQQEKEYNCMPGGIWTYIVITWNGTPGVTDILAYQDGVLLAPLTSQDRTGSRESDAAFDLL